MRWLGVLVVVCACDGKSVKAPTPESVDRGCARDADCTIVTTFGCCDTSCGDGHGTAVNGRAWLKADDQRRASCEGVKCPYLTCVKLPACRDESFAVCRANRCEVERRPAAACAGRTPMEACEQTHDCVLAAKPDCCDHCPDGPPWRAINRWALAEAQAALDCAAVTCPAHGECEPPAVAVGCVDGRCTVMPPSPPSNPSGSEPASAATSPPASPPSSPSATPSAGSSPHPARPSASPP